MSPRTPRPPKWRSKMPKCGYQSSQISSFGAKKVASQKAGESRIGGRRQRAKPLRSATVPLGTRVACLPRRAELRLHFAHCVKLTSQQVNLFYLYLSQGQPGGFPRSALPPRRNHRFSKICCFCRAGPPSQNSPGGLKMRRMRCRSRFGSAFGLI